MRSRFLAAPATGQPVRALHQVVDNSCEMSNGHKRTSVKTYHSDSWHLNSRPRPAGYPTAKPHQYLGKYLLNSHQPTDVTRRRQPGLEVRMRVLISKPDQTPKERQAAQGAQKEKAAAGWTGLGDRCDVNGTGVGSTATRSKDPSRFFWVVSSDN